jgi:hypothetical protein
VKVEVGLGKKTSKVSTVPVPDFPTTLLDENSCRTSGIIKEEFVVTANVIVAKGEFV